MFLMNLNQDSFFEPQQAKHMLGLFSTVTPVVRQLEKNILHGKGKKIWYCILAVVLYIFIFLTRTAISSNLVNYLKPCFWRFVR